MTKLKTIKSLFSNNAVLLIITALIVSALSFGAVFALQKRSSTTQKETARETTTKKCEVEICVEITKDGIVPDVISVKVGEYVQFNSADGQKHNISNGKGADVSAEGIGRDEHEVPHEHVGAYASGEFQADEAWRVQFKEKGTIKLHDHFNPKQYIAVIVYQPSTDTQ